MPNPEIGLLDRYSDGKCDNLTLVNSLNKLRMKCLHSKSMRTTLEGSHKLERQSMSRSTHNNIGRPTKYMILFQENIRKHSPPPYHKSGFWVGLENVEALIRNIFPVPYARARRVYIVRYCLQP